MYECQTYELPACHIEWNKEKDGRIKFCNGTHIDPFKHGSMWYAMDLNLNSFFDIFSPCFFRLMYWEWVNAIDAISCSTFSQVKLFLSPFSILSLFSLFTQLAHELLFLTLFHNRNCVSRSCRHIISVMSSYYFIFSALLLSEWHFKHCIFSIEIKRKRKISIRFAHWFFFVLLIALSKCQLTNDVLNL